MSPPANMTAAKSAVWIREVSQLTPLSPALSPAGRGGLSAASASEQPLSGLDDAGAIEPVARVHVRRAAAAAVGAGAHAQSHEPGAEAVVGRDLGHQRA